MEIDLSQLHNLAYTALVPCNAWKSWHLLHACYAEGQIPPPALMDAHQPIVVCHMSTIKTQQPWPRGTPWLGHYWCSWEEVTDDLIGPGPASTSHGDVEFFALTCILAPQLTLWSLQGYLRNLVTTLLHGLSTPGSPSTQKQCKSFMTMRESSLVLPFKSFNRFWR